MTATTQIKKDIPVRPYHSGARKRIKSVQGEYYGFEMEVDFPGKNMRQHNCVVPNGNVVRSRYQLDAETDGSLNNSGVELITKRPLKVTEVRGKWMDSIIARMTDEMGVQRGKQPNDYGLHINVNLEGMTVLEVSAFFATLNFAMSMNTVQQNIMERGTTYNGLEGSIQNMVYQVSDKTGITAKVNKLYNTGMLTNFMLPGSRQNYAGIRSTKAPIAEIRGFHMNTDIAAFKKKAELVQKARRFANDNVELMLNFFVNSLETGTNVLASMSYPEKAELLDRILSTPLNAPLVRKQFEPNSRALELVAGRLIDKYKYTTELEHNRMPLCDADGTLRTRQ